MSGVSGPGSCYGGTSSILISRLVSAWSRSSLRSRHAISASDSAGAEPRSRPLSSTSGSWPASETSTRTKRSGELGSILRALRASSASVRSGLFTAASDARSRRGSRVRGQLSAITGRRTERPAVCSTSSRCTDAVASRVRAAGHRSKRRGSPAAAPGSAQPANAERKKLGGQLLVEPAALVEPPELGIAADRFAVDEDLRHGPAARQVEQLLTESGVVVQVDLVVLDRRPVEQRFCANAVAAPGCRIHLNACHAGVKR